MEQFGHRVVSLREAKAWTRRELAKRADLHENHLSKIEQGTRKRIEAETIIKLCRALHISADCLLALGEDLPGHLVYERPGTEAL